MTAPMSALARPFSLCLLRPAALMAAGWLSLCALPAMAQQDAPSQQEVETKRQELESIETTLEQKRRTAEKLQAELERLARERADINARLVDTAASVQKLERAILASEARLAELQAEQTRLRHGLKAQEATIAKIIGALQRMGRNPPPALLVQPGDVLGAVRSAILMGAVVPALREKARAIAGDLARLKTIAGEIASERDDMARQQVILKAQQQDLESLLAARRELASAKQQAFEAASRRADELAGKAASLKELIASLEEEAAIARARAEAARQLESRPGDNVYAALSSPGRIAMKVPFTRQKGQLPLPAAGSWHTGFGADDGLGGTTKGMTLVTLPQASVTSPAEGWVIYAGPFRSYGDILILDAGDGYHILMAGMARVLAETGQFVLAGEPVAQMGTQSAAIAGLGFSAAREKPMLYIEFRKDGASIDPAPWWQDAKGRISG